METTKTYIIEVTIYNCNGEFDYRMQFESNDYEKALKCYNIQSTLNQSTGTRTVTLYSVETRKTAVATTTINPTKVIHGNY